MRKCTKCEVEYEHYGQRSGFCRPCKRTYDREYYHSKDKASKERKMDLQKDRRKGIKDRYTEWKQDKGCSHCTENDPICLDLHHLDPKEKEISLGDAIRRGWTFDRMMQEASKCIVLCANCHRKEHERLGSKVRILLS